ncbi:hypothetical protein J8C01_14670 [Chloracidobacterium sp. D]|uniref:hypothetical protein n=1 Tax=Chloracidobacterium sp. D TaxID=2821536 RepID=UPI001B8B82A9|nr:hypothetical protein [Chloracidobacterium sp. D]QUV83151.1 hypothetical protein J8C01_14670 [Chloracidobacterium sp. D]
MESSGGCKTHFLDGWCPAAWLARALRMLLDSSPDVPGVEKSGQRGARESARPVEASTGQWVLPVAVSGVWCPSRS